MATQYFFSMDETCDLALLYLSVKQALEYELLMSNIRFSARGWQWRQVWHIVRDLHSCANDGIRKLSRLFRVRYEPLTTPPLQSYCPATQWRTGTYLHFENRRERGTISLLGVGQSMYEDD
jgi:hypothetical protein